MSVRPLQLSAPLRGCCWLLLSLLLVLSSCNESCSAVPFSSGDRVRDPAPPQPVPSYNARYVVTQWNPLGGGSGFRGKMSLQSGTQGPYGGDVQNLAVDVMFETNDRLHVKIYDADHARWEVPFVVTEPVKPYAPHPNYEFSYVEAPFSFAVKRKVDGAVIFNTTGFSFAFEDQFINFASWIPQNANVYGLGERIHSFRLDPTNKQYTIFNADKGNPVDENLYGAHPFYLEYRQDTGHAHGVFLLNSNAMDVVLAPGSVEFRLIGGVADLYFFMGPDPESVIRQYHDVIGHPFLIPQWALGFHQCRWGYQTLDEVKQVVANYSANGLPLEAQWTDIDYMQDYKDFTTDSVRFPADEFRAFVEDLHRKGQHYVVIIDPGISVNDSYAAYMDGMKRQVFIATSSSTSSKYDPMLNRVWPGITAFPDFTSQEAHDYWADQIEEFLNVVPVDGLWIDMNEIAGFCDDTCSKSQSSEKTRAGNSLLSGSFNPDSPPYVPGGVSLNARTLGMSGVMKNGQLMYNTHNLYGFTEAIATSDALKALKKQRPFVISRSTFPGHGSHAGHWSGDNFKTFESMQSSIPSSLNMNLFGIPLMGSDICGFNHADHPANFSFVELCARWMELGSFYMFSRNHNAIGEDPQEPYALGDLVLQVSKKVLQNRMSLLPHYYSLMFRAHLSGGTVWRPLFFEFPRDTSSNIALIDRQFLVGRGLMVSPVLDQGAVSVPAYFPADLWYDYWTSELVYAPNGGDKQGAWKTIEAPIDHIPVHIRGGTIIPKQKPGLTVQETRANPLEVVVAFGLDGSAVGELFIDDGESLPMAGAEEFTHIWMWAKSAPGEYGQFTTHLAVHGYPDVNQWRLGTVRFLGAQCAELLSVLVNGKDALKSAAIDPSSGAITLSGLQVSLGSQVQVMYQCQ